MIFFLSMKDTVHFVLKLYRKNDFLISYLNLNLNWDALSQAYIKSGHPLFNQLNLLFSIIHFNWTTKS